MSAIFLNPEEAERRLDHPDNSQRGSYIRKIANAKIVTPEVVVLPKNNGGRREGDKTLDMTARALIGLTAHFDTQRNVARDFGVSQPTVSDAKNGLVGTRPDAELRSRLETKLGSVKERAVDVLLESLGVITKEKLEKLDPGDAADVAAKMAGVVDRVTPKSPDAGLNIGQLVMYIPEQKSLDDFEEVFAMPF